MSNSTYLKLFSLVSFSFACIFFVFSKNFVILQAFVLASAPPSALFVSQLLNIEFLLNLLLLLLALLTGILGLGNKRLVASRA